MSALLANITHNGLQSSWVHTRRLAHIATRPTAASHSQIVVHIHWAWMFWMTYSSVANVAAMNEVMNRAAAADNRSVSIFQKFVLLCDYRRSLRRRFLIIAVTCNLLPLCGCVAQSVSSSSSPITAVPTSSSSCLPAFPAAAASSNHRLVQVHAPRPGSRRFNTLLMQEE